MKVTIVTNIPPPYRNDVYRLTSRIDLQLRLLFCAEKESNREWKVPKLLYDHVIMKTHLIKKNGVYIHFNPQVWSELNEYRPDIVITTGFNPTHILSFVWALIHRAKHICMTDGTLRSESILGLKHRLIRKIVFRYSSAFIAASRGGFELYRSYKQDEEKLFQSHLCANNDAFIPFVKSERKYDVLFCGRFEKVKNPLFFVDVVKAIQNRRGNIKVLLVGSGKLLEVVLNKLDESKISYDYLGFVQQDELPRIYSSARILLFTTSGDTWGVVANEAMAAGTPVITSPQAGVAGEIVVDGKTGFVREMVVNEWSEATCELLDNQDKWKEFSDNSLKIIQKYNYQAAADGIAAACFFAVQKT